MNIDVRLGTMRFRYMESRRDFPNGDIEIEARLFMEHDYGAPIGFASSTLIRASEMLNSDGPRLTRYYLRRRIWEEFSEKLRTQVGFDFTGGEKG